MDSPEYNFEEIIEFKNRNSLEERDRNHDAKIFERELGRLEISLEQLPADAHLRLAMTHYPPVDHHLNSSRASELFEKYRVNCVVFGHLHQLKKNVSFFGEARGVRYILTAADFLNFSPILVAECS
jgi:uncharacterized protein